MAPLDNVPVYCTIPAVNHSRILAVAFWIAYVVKLLAETCFLYDWWRKYHPKSPKPINATPEPSYINIPIGGRCDAHAVCGGVLTVG